MYSRCLSAQGDEVNIYESLHGALKERLPTPDLVVYLRADTEVLMQRIAMRDRPYERSMDRAYIHALATAYDGYFGNYQDAPLLVIDTNERDFVRHETDRAWITGGLVFASPSQVAIDLLTGTPEGQAFADDVITWMVRRRQ